MSRSNTTVCKTCGAVVFGDQCDLCGTPVDTRSSNESVALEVAAEDAPAVAPARARPDNGEPTANKRGNRTVCPSCGAANRTDAKFCDQCGQGFDEPAVMEERPPKTREAPKPRTKKAPANAEKSQPRIGLYVTVAVVTVVALYFLSAMSRQSPTPAGPAQSSAPAAASSSVGDLDTYLPEDEGLAGSIAQTRSSIDAATDPEQRVALRQQIVQAYSEAGRLDLAGREQEAIASELKAADAWASAGNLHFDWMENQSGTERIKAAQRAARDYEKSLEIDPDNLDVRTDLGVAYLNDPSSPMLAIKNTNMVLEADSNHVQANFNKGVMLAQIGRTEEAIRHFRKVIKLAKPGDPAYERAQEVLTQLGAPQNGSTGTSG